MPIEPLGESKVRLFFKKCFSFAFEFLSADYRSADWQVNSESDKRERQCTYKVGVTAVFGSTTICSTEKQVEFSIKSLAKSNFSLR